MSSILVEYHMLFKHANTLFPCFAQLGCFKINLNSTHHKACAVWFFETKQLTKTYEGEAPSMVFIDADYAYGVTRADGKNKKTAECAYLLRSGWHRYAAWEHTSG